MLGILAEIEVHRRRVEAVPLKNFLGAAEHVRFMHSLGDFQREGCDIEAAGEHPELLVADGLDAGNRVQLRHTRCEPGWVEHVGQPLHEHQGGLADQGPRAVHDEARDQQGAHRVHKCPPKCADDKRRDDDADGTEGVRRQVQKNCCHVGGRVTIIRARADGSEAMVMLCEEADTDAVDYQPRDSHWQELGGVHARMREEEPRHRLACNCGSGQEEEQGVCKGAENLVPGIAIRVRPVGRPPGCHLPEETHCDASAVHEHVAGVGHEGE
mmetsp:Transcript_13632/g.40217  ORF Transcript_13632/g.40217 Transcript_13632/m.40217 type:complete len:269 (-) Transcript_13632:314-1120(-)